MTDDIEEHIEERNGYQVFVAPEDGELSLNKVDEWDEDTDPPTPSGWGPSISVSEGDEVVMGFVTDDN